MNTGLLASAQLRKASHSLRCEQAEGLVREGVTLLAGMARGGSTDKELDDCVGLVAEAFRRQLLLIVEGARLDREIEEAKNG